MAKRHHDVDYKGLIREIVVAAQGGKDLSSALELYSQRLNGGDSIEHRKVQLILATHFIQQGYAPELEMACGAGAMDIYVHGLDWCIEVNQNPPNTEVIRRKISLYSPSVRRFSFAFRSDRFDDVKSRYSSVDDVIQEALSVLGALQEKEHESGHHLTSLLLVTPYPVSVDEYRV